MPGTETVLKIMVAGDGGVGKTALLLKFVKGSFVADTTMTIGVQFHFKVIKVDGKDYTLQLWDLGGQDRFRFILPKYTLGARGALILYDMTRMASLNSLEEWVNICRTYSKTLPILLCGTKADLVDYISVPKDIAEGFLQTNNLCGHLQLSAKSGQNVENAFELIVTEIIKQA